MRVDDVQVSRLQARVSLTGEGYLIESLGRNPVKINDSAAQSQVLKDGDRVCFGEAVYEISLVGDDNETIFLPEATAEDPDKTLFCSSWPRLVVYEGAGNGQSLELNGERAVIGRAADTALRLDDQRVSREHLAVERRSDGFYVVLLSRTNTLEVNGAEVREARLYDGDHLRINPFALRFESTRAQDRRSDDATPAVFSPEGSPPDATRFVPRIVEQRLGPRLVLEQSDGSPRVFSLDAPRVTIGRGDHCAVQLDGDTISRVHAVVARREGGYFAIALSGTNPILVNGARVEEARLFRGDSLQVGDYLFTFVSERTEDEHPAEKQVVVKRKGPPRIVVLVAGLLMLVMAIFLGYEYLVRPWQLEKRIDEARLMLSSHRDDDATGILTRVLDANPPAGLAIEARALMAGSVLDRAREFRLDSRLAEAESLLVNYLKSHGAGVEAEPLWGLLDEVRFARGQRYESQGESRKAIRMYLAIPGDSALYGQAQQALSELWVSVQQVKTDPAADSRAMTDLLHQADVYFTRKQYLTPANANAYSIYRTVLTLDPGNTIALTRIGEMRDFYRNQGERLCRAGDSVKAGVYFQRYLLIDPDDRAVRERAAACAGSEEGPVTERPAGEISEQSRARQDKVRQLLDESGVESGWIMEFLFEEKEEGSAESETPW